MCWVLLWVPTEKKGGNAHTRGEWLWLGVFVLVVRDRRVSVGCQEVAEVIVVVGAQAAMAVRVR